MKAVVWENDGNLHLNENYPYPNCKDDWVVIKVVSAEFALPTWL